MSSVRAEARMLIDRYGEESVEFSRDIAFAATRNGANADRAWHVNALIERPLGVHRQPDTATRCPEGSRRRGQHPFLW